LDFLFFFSGLFIWEPLEALLFLWALHLGTFGGRNGKKGNDKQKSGEAVAVRPKPKF